MKITESQSQDRRWEPIDTLCLQALCGSTIQHSTSTKLDEHSTPPTKELVWSLLKVSCTYYTIWNIVQKVKKRCNTFLRKNHLCLVFVSEISFRVPPVYLSNCQCA